MSICSDRRCYTEKSTMCCHLNDISNVINVLHTVMEHGITSLDQFYRTMS